MFQLCYVMTTCGFEKYKALLFSFLSEMARVLEWRECAGQVMSRKLKGRHWTDCLMGLPYVCVTRQLEHSTIAKCDTSKVCSTEQEGEELDKLLSNVARAIRKNNLNMLARAAIRKFKNTKIPRKYKPDTFDRSAVTKQNNLILDHPSPESNLYPFNEQYLPTTNCNCKHSRGDRDHFLLHCSRHTEARDKMINLVETGYIRTSTEFHLRTLNVERLLGPNTDLVPEMKRIITASVKTFLLSTCAA